MDKNQLICIVCPLGCHLEVEKDDKNTIIVKGNQCKRGEAYAIKETTHPVRMLPTTVKITNGMHPRLPVITDKPIDKKLLIEVMKIVKTITVNAPIKKGDVIYENLLDTNVNLIASRSMEKG